MSALKMNSVNISKICNVYNRLQDQESRDLFDLRTEYAIYRNRNDFINKISTHARSCKMSKKFVEKYSKSQGVIVYGCGQEGIIAKRSIELCGYTVECFCDRIVPEDGVSDGKRVISTEEAINNYSTYLFVIGSTRYLLEMYANLVRCGIKDEHIYISEVGMVAGFDSEGQYFDLFSADKDEIFIDAGAYDGKTTEDFIKWTNNTYKRIYCYEPLEFQANHIEKSIKTNEWENVELIRGAVWHRAERQPFYENSTGSCIQSNGASIINCVTIDDTISSEVTYIKMDVEGAELKALEGARNTLQLYKPKLAISIYHKPEDIFEIPAYILDIVPEYEFWIRHYSTNIWETVLYGRCSD